MKRVLVVPLVLALVACKSTGDESAQSPYVSLRSIRAALKTNIVRDPRRVVRAPPPLPPAGVLDLVKYDAPVGKLWAYVTPPPAQPGKSPAIVWAGGGFDNDIGATFFAPGPPENDQSAAAFREAGVVTMYPSFRGGNDNPGRYEQLLGEVDDFLAAVEYVRRLAYVDPDRVYIGGHSTGGTLVLLAAALSDRFQEAIVFGPIDDISAYRDRYMPFDPSAKQEILA